MNNYFLTGATGLLGANLAKKLSKQDKKLSLLIRKGSSHPFLKSVKHKAIYGDLFDTELLEKCLKDIDYVFHIAGAISYSKWDRELLYKVNVEGTRNILNACLENQVKKLVFVSSTAAIGIPKKGEIANEKYPFFEEYKKIPYMHSKKQAEEIALSFNQKGLEVVAVCPSTIFGAGDIKMNTGELIKNISQEKIPLAPLGGTAVVSVSDCVDGLLKALEEGKAGEKYILSNENLKMIDLMNIIARKLGVKKIKKTMPKHFLPFLKTLSHIAESLFRHKKFTPALINFSAKDRYFSNEKARRELDWQPKVTIEKALEEAIHFYKENGYL